MFGSGARIGTVIIRKKTWLTRKDQKTVKTVCCVAVPGTTILRFCRSARRVKYEPGYPYNLYGLRVCLRPGLILIVYGLGPKYFI